MAGSLCLRSGTKFMIYELTDTTFNRDFVLW
jgi:hypothetical protein